MLFSNRDLYFRKIINDVIYIDPLKERTKFWREAGPDGWLNLFGHNFALVSYYSFKLCILIAYRF